MPCQLMLDRCANSRPMLEAQLQTGSPNNAHCHHTDSLIQLTKEHDKLRCDAAACTVTCLGAERSCCRHGSASCNGDVVMVVKRMVVGQADGWWE